MRYLLITLTLMILTSCAEDVKVETRFEDYTENEALKKRVDGELSNLDEALIKSANERYKREGKIKDVQKWHLRDIIEDEKKNGDPEIQAMFRDTRPEQIDFELIDKKIEGNWVSWKFRFANNGSQVVKGISLEIRINDNEGIERKERAYCKVDLDPESSGEVLSVKQGFNANNEEEKWIGEYPIGKIKSNAKIQIIALSYPPTTKSRILGPEDTEYQTQQGK